MTMADDRTLFGEWRTALGRGLALWGTLAVLGYRCVLWQDTGEWLPVTLFTVAGIRLDLSGIGLQGAGLWLTGLPLEVWTLTLGGLILIVSRRRG